MCSKITIPTFLHIYVGDIYFQPLSPSPLVVGYFQPVNLTFLLAIRSDGISNRLSKVPVFQYDASGNPVMQLHEAVALESSSQLFTLELGYAGQHTPENYTICMYSNFISQDFKHLYFYIFNTVENDVNVGSMLVVLSEGEFYTYIISYM